MRIAIDIDGVVDIVPDLLSVLTKSIRVRKGKVFILTSRENSEDTVSQSLKFVKEKGIEFDDYFFLPDSTTRPEGDFPKDLDWHRKQIWQKAEFCLNNRIDYFFEDDPITIELVKRFSPKTKVLKVEGAF